MTSIALQSPEPPAPPPSTTIDVDLPCIRCNYDLRTQTAEGRCPECLAPVIWSLQGDLRVRPVKRWLDAQILGCAITSISVTTLLFSLASMAWSSTEEVWIATLLDLAMVLGSLGLLTLGWPEVDAESPDHAWFYRPVMWFLGALVMFAVLLQRDWLEMVWHRLAIVWPEYRVLTTTMILRAAWVIAIAYLRRMAPRFGADRLVPETYLFLFGVLVAVAAQWAAYTGMPMIDIKPPLWWMSTVRWIWAFQAIWAITLFMRYGYLLWQAQRHARKSSLISP